MDAEAAAKMVRKYPHTIVGIKTAHFQPPTWDAVDRAVKAAELSKTRGDGRFSSEARPRVSRADPRSTCVPAIFTRISTAA